MLLAAYFASFVLALTAAQEPAPAPPAADAPVQTAPDVAPPAAATPEDLAAVAQLCERIEANAAMEALDELSANVNLDALLAGAFEGIEVNAELIAGMRNSLEAAQPPWKNIVETNRTHGGVLHFIRTQPVLPLRGLFRHTGGHGLDYIECEFARDAHGDLRVVDFKSHAQSIWAQDNFRDMSLPALALMQKDGGWQPPSRDAALVRDWARLKLVNEKKESDPVAALKHFALLSDEIRFEPTILLLRVRIAAAVSNDEYLASIDEFAKHHPDSTALPLLMLERHFLREEWDAALATLDRIDALVGGDPYLDLMRANVLLAARRFDEALSRADSAGARDPRIVFDALWIPVNVALALKDDVAVYESLVRIDERFELEWGDLSQIPEYAEFANSPQYQQWLRYLESKSKR